MMLYKSVSSAVFVFAGNTWYLTCIVVVSGGVGLVKTAMIGHF